LISPKKFPRSAVPSSTGMLAPADRVMRASPQAAVKTVAAAFVGTKAAAVARRGRGTPRQPSDVGVRRAGSRRRAEPAKA
jgi:hypothetical protein